MCVILQIEPGVKMPSDKLVRACDINPDGYGIAYIAKHEGLKVIRSVKKNDPKEVQDHLDKLKDTRVFVHLRYATVGSVSLANNHPFIVLRSKKTVDMAMMHNGTIANYSPPKDNKECSDTQLFANNLVAPAALRSAALLKANRVLTDPIFRRLIDLEAGVSVLVLFDRWGNVWKVNESRGKQFDGWWASNDYSFDDKHFRSSARTSVPHVSHTRWRPLEQRGVNYGRMGHNSRALPWEEDVLDPISDKMREAVDGWRKETAPKHVLPFSQSPHTLTKAVPYHKGGFLMITTQCKAVGAKVKDTSESDKSMRNLSVPRTTFLEMAGMQSLEELGTLTAPDVEELCKNFPAAMSQMFVDLYGEYRDLKRDNGNQARTILGLTQDKGGKG